MTKDDASRRLFQETERAKEESSRLLYEGNVPQATALLRTTSGSRRMQSVGLPAEQR